MRIRFVGEWDPVAVHILFRKTTVCHPADSLCVVGSLVIEVWLYMIKWLRESYDRGVCGLSPIGYEIHYLGCNTLGGTVEI